MSISSHLHQLFKLNHDRICFVNHGGEGGSRFLRDPKGGTSLWLRGGVTFFKGIQKGGKKNPVNQNENLQTPPPSS